MSLITRLALSATILAGTAGVASAQSAPGVCDCETPAAEPAPVAAPRADLPRWGVGLHLSALTLAPESAPDAETQYAGGGIQVRYRLAPRWQLGLDIDHVAVQLDDGSTGDELLSTTLSAMYHFRPHARWDWYALAGIGAVVDGAEDLSDEARQDSRMAQVHLGVGVERRFRHLAIGAELRAVGMAKPDQEDTPVIEGASAAPAPSERTSGGQLSLGVSYYF